MPQPATLIEIEGDEDGEFVEMIGSEGQLELTSTTRSPQLNWFHSPYGDIGFYVEHLHKEGAQIEVRTKLGNIFKFRI